MLKFIVVAVIVTYVNSLALPKYITTCSMSDPNFGKCAADAANKAIPLIAAGDKEFGIPSSKPYKVTAVDLSTGSLKLKLRNLEIFGLEKVVVKNLETDFKHVKLLIRADHLKFKSNYEVDGRVLVLPIKGSGPSEFDFFGMDIEYNFDFEKFDRKGKTYAKLKNPLATYKLEKASYQLNNLFNGDDRLGGEINKLINENWEVINTDIYDPISQTISAICTSIAESYFKKIPYNEAIRP